MQPHANRRPYAARERFGGQLPRIRFGWIPVPVLLILMAMVWRIAPPDPFEPPFFRASLDFLFVIAVPAWAAGLATHSFLRNRSVPILLFGSGLLLFSVIHLLSSIAYHQEAFRTAAALFTIGMGAVGALHLLAAIVASAAWDWVARKAWPPIIFIYGAILSLPALLVLTASSPLVTALFPQEAEIIPLQRMLFVPTIFFFAFTSLMLTWISRQRNWSFGAWYGLALALVAVGLFGLAISPQPGSPVAWIARAAQYIGGLYLLIAVLRYRDSSWQPVAYSPFREIETPFRTLAAGSWEGMALCEDGVITDANEQLGRILGYSVPELIGRAIPELIPPERRSQVMAGLLGGTEVAVEHPMIRKHGSRIIVETHGSTISRPTDAIQLWAIRDITARKQQERAVRESEEQFRALFENMSEAFGVGEPIFDEKNVACDLRFTRINRAFLHHTGLGPDLTGKPLKSILPRLEKKWITLNARVVATGQPERFDHFDIDTQRHYQGVSYSPGPGKFALLFRDITPEKCNEEILRQANEANERNLAQLRAIIQQMTEGLAIYDPQGNLLEMNPAALAMHGFENSEAARQQIGDPDAVFHAFELFDLDDSPLPPQDWPLRRVLRGESFDSFLIHIRRIDTGKNWFASLGGTPVYDEEGNVLIAIVTLRDITKHQRTQQALKRSRDKLEQRVQARTAELQYRADQLARLTSELALTEQRERKRLAQILHDHLQQLLVGARFKLHMLLKSAPEDQKKAIQGVDTLLDETISVSRALPMELSPPILHEAGLVAGLEWLARWVKSKQGLTIDLSADPNLIVEREDIRLLIFQSIRELLLNISKHAKVNQARISLSRVGTTELKAVVEDEGRGFNPAAVLSSQNKNIDAFGLFAIRERIELIGGNLKIQSAPGEGARFTLTVPLPRENIAALEEATAPKAFTPSQTPMTPASPGPHKIRLLLVDDHAVVRQGLSALLSSQKDLEIVGEADDGAAAITRARELQPDIILMDFSMPRMNGMEATRAIHKEMPQVKIIGLSMYDEIDRAHAMLSVGAVAYRSKSGKSEELLATIRRQAKQKPAA